MNMEVASRRKSRLACEPCRQRKRKCDEREPCFSCTRYGYECFYKLQRPKKIARLRTKVQTSGEEELPTAQESGVSVSDRLGEHSNIPITLSEQQQLSKVRSSRLLNSDGNQHQSMIVDSWNLGLRIGGRFENTIMDIVSFDEAETYAAIYFKKVHPVYHFVNVGEFSQALHRRWTSSTTDHDAILCGVVALGSLFSGARAHLRESSLVEIARCELEKHTHTHGGPSSLRTIRGWILRVLYLRMARDPHSAWTASCACIAAAEGKCTRANKTGQATVYSIVPNASNGDKPNDLHHEHARLHWVARLLHTWICRDFNVSQMYHAGLEVPCTIPLAEDLQDWTPTLISMFCLANRWCNPADPKTLAQLTSFLHEIDGLDLERHPVLQLHKANHAFCIYRYMRFTRQVIPPSTLKLVIDMSRPSLIASSRLADDEQPWWHVAHVPFQFLCVMLAMDTRDSLQEVEDAMTVLRKIENCFSTERMRNVTKTAEALVEMCRCDKLEAMASLSRSQQRTTANDPITTDDSGVGTPLQIPQSSDLADSVTSVADDLDSGASNLDATMFNWDDFMNVEFPIDFTWATS